ncbi:hypothetical protein Gotur_026710, partial [Gossypium turneri]
MPSGSQAQVEVLRLKDQMAQMQATTVEVQRKYEELQLELKVEAAAREAEATVREAEVQKKYEELQLQLKVDAASREAEQSRKYDELQQQ